MSDPRLPVAPTLTQWIGLRAQRHGNRTAVRFIEDDDQEISWTYDELWRRASHFSRQLPQVSQFQPRALMLFPPGLEFLAGFLGAQLAGWIPVPTCYPKPGREMPRLDSAAIDCQPAAIVGDAETLRGVDRSKLCRAARDLPMIATDCADPQRVTPIDANSLSIDPDSLALLQYTSGSTSEPKGVMVRHRNLMANLEAIRQGFQIDWQADDCDQVDVGVFWLPFFHDMGLIGGILTPLYVGGQTVLISPRSFLQRPVRWLRLISEYGAVISGAPNFAYQLCADRIVADATDGIDLSRWRIAFCGAEPVLPETLREFANQFRPRGFSESAFYPCYGLAEATLLAAGGNGPRVPKVIAVDRESLSQGKPHVVADIHQRGVQRLVSCGAATVDTDVLVVDPQTRRAKPSGCVGEIWLRGAGITAGYWNRDAENEGRFGAQLENGDEGYCRTGDLGFYHDAELYITGRIKDVIILRGRNLAPQDIELTVRHTMGSEGGQAAAFAVDGPRGEALAIIAELPRRTPESQYPELVRQLRRAVIDAHEVDPRYVLLVRQATVPLTSSGKIQRRRCRELFDADQIKFKHRYDQASVGEQTPIPMPEIPRCPSPSDRESIAGLIETWLTHWLVARAGVDPASIELEKPFADYGLDSLSAVELSAEIEAWSGIELTPVAAWNHPNIARMSAFIADSLIQAFDAWENVQGGACQSELNEAELESLLDEVEHLSDEEIRHALADKQRPETF